jgi:hypothetical protein
MSAFDRQRQKDLNIGKTFINTIGVDKFGNETHFMSSVVVSTSISGSNEIYST